MNFTLSELATLIRLVEKEEVELHIQIEEDEQVSDDAADLSVQIGKISGKLKELYDSQWSEGSNHPAYSEVIKNYQAL
ncbi:MAG: hypothetical protein V4732_06520 [Pseudomonadota bacterium]